jgi:hypothetical protein
MSDFSENSFTKEVREYLCTAFGVEYIGKFLYTEPTEENDNYSLQWLENNQDRPYVMAYNCDTEEEFFLYVCGQIKEKRFWLKQVFILKRTDENGKT